MGVTGYDVYMNSAYLGSTNGTTTTYTATWLNPSTSYTFTVRAKDATGNTSAASSAFTTSTGAYVARPVASVFTATSWYNPFSGNVINDAGQTAASAGSSALRQNEELRAVLTNTPQYQNVYQSTFTNVVNLSGNSTFSVNIRSSADISLRVKLFDDAGNSIDAWQNTLYVTGDNAARNYTLNFAGPGFGTVNSSRVKGIVFMYPNAAAVSGTLYFDELRLGAGGDTQAPTAPANLASPSKTDNSVTLSWSASTDNVGVTGYDVFNGGVKVNTANITTTGYTVTGLSAATAYTFTVKAKDAAGNTSAASSGLNVTTASALRNPENPAGTVGGLDYKYYEGTWSVLPNFDALTPVKTGTVAGFDMSVRNQTDNYGFKYTGYVDVPTDGTYTFYTSSDDGSKLYIGATEVVNNDGLHGIVEQSGAIAMKAGKHALAVTFFEAGGGEHLSVSYAGPGITKQLIPGSALFRTGGTTGGSGTGLQAAYFNNTTLSAPSVLTRTDATVDFNWQKAAPGTGVNVDYFSVRWTGQVEAPVTGSYTFSTISDDGVRLWVNGAQVINNWTDHAVTTDNSAAISLTGGQKYDIRMEFYDGVADAQAKLLWAYPGQAQQIIPQSRLFPAAAQAYTKVTGTYFGTAPWSGCSTCTYDKAFDGSTSTYFDAATGSGGYTGVDAGTGKVVTRIRFYPRSGWAHRMMGGKFQGSNTGTSSGFVDLYTIPSMPADAWQQVDIPNTTAYRYLRYLGPADGYGNVAEVEFYTGSSGARRSAENQPAFAGATLYPNPASGVAYLTLTTPDAGEVRVTLSNSIGVPVRGMTKAVHAGENTLALPIARLRSGVYVVRLQQGDRQLVKKLVVE